MYDHIIHYSIVLICVVYQTAIAKAESFEEVERLKQLLQSGQIPGKDDAAAKKKSQGRSTFRRKATFKQFFLSCFSLYLFDLALTSECLYLNP